MSGQREDDSNRRVSGVGAKDPDDVSIGAVVNDRYELIRFIESGGMGTVWEARDVELGRPVALKFMSSQAPDAEEYRRRFKREARAAAKMGSRHVVQIFDQGLMRDVPFIVMELLEGEDLKKRLKQRGRLTLTEAANLLRQICKAIHLAHEAGMIHRDLKPGNIFFAMTKDGEEVVKILDFGIAKLQEDEPSHDTTSTGAIVGSPQYMSPEQGRALKNIDHRSDLFSLGVVLYQALTGRRPFTGESAGDLIYQICSARFPPPSSYLHDLPPGVDAYFAKALTKEREGRFQSAREMAQAFFDLVPATPSSQGHLSFDPDSTSGTFPAPASFPGQAPPAPRASLPSDSALNLQSSGTLGSALIPAAPPSRMRVSLTVGALVAVGGAAAVAAALVFAPAEGASDTPAAAAATHDAAPSPLAEPVRSASANDAAEPTASLAAPKPSTAASAPPAASSSPSVNASAKPSASIAPSEPTSKPATRVRRRKTKRGKPLFGRH